MGIRARSRMAHAFLCSSPKHPKAAARGHRVALVKKTALGWLLHGWMWEGSIVPGSRSARGVTAGQSLANPKAFASSQHRGRKILSISLK